MNSFLRSLFFALGSVFLFHVPGANAAENSFFSTLKFSVEAKGNYRDSDLERFATKTPLPREFLPPGQTSLFLETVDEGRHWEVSSISFFADGKFTEDLSLHLKVDTVDLYDRNPTSGDRKVDLDEGYLLWGRDYKAFELPEESGAYARIGKFQKFERQNDRHLESYGLLSTAFNRFEDAGLEAGYFFGQTIYVKASYTTGNPVFFRDPNALAGDNGTDDRRAPPPNNPNPDLKSGILILYDAEIESFDLAENPEISGGAGFRFGSEETHRLANLLFFGSKRDLADTVKLNGTFYGGDVDLLDGVFGFGLPMDGADKTEYGANLWVYFDNWTLFAQYADQKLAQMTRSGYEAEISYSFALPGFGGDDFDKKFFTRLSPAIRYSKLEPDFVGHPFYPAPSVWWEWDKLDYGARIDVYKNLQLTVEYADHTFVRGGKDEKNNELLATLRWKYTV